MILKSIVIRLVPLLLLFALGYSFFIPSAGERQFLRTEAALVKAQSYRVEEISQGTTIDHFRLEVVCPDRRHSLQTLDFSERKWDTPQAVSVEHVDAGHLHYSRYFANADWKEQPGEPTLCHPMPFLQDGNLPDFKQIRALGRIVKQGMDTVVGQACREWVVTFHTPNGNDKVFDYCIGSDDLPRRLRTNENSFQIVIVWSDWNQPIEIELPELQK